MPAPPYSLIWQQALLRIWIKRGPVAWLLWLPSLCYRCLMVVRASCYRLGWLSTPQLPVPVVVVGNVVVGGSGKTPLAIELITHLQRRGIQVGVIARGYGRRHSGCLEVRAHSLAAEVGDEPVLIYRRTKAPMFVARKRVQAAQALLAHYPQTQIILSDDGLQHLALQRQLELGVFDERGIGNGFLLPAGPLREPWPRALDLLVHSGAPALAGFVLRRTLADYAVNASGETISLAELAQASTPPLLAVAAIAKPESFFAMLRDRGLHLAATMALPDHHDFQNWKASQTQGWQIICTEKDAVKLWPLAPKAWAVPLLVLLPDDFWRTFDQAVDARLTGAQATPPAGQLS